MNTRQISFPLQGMFCAKCAVDIEHALTQLDGVVAAQVNYATERAVVLYDPTRVPAVKIVAAIRAIGFDTPLGCLTVYADDLLYAPSARVVERVLQQAEGVAEATVDLARRQVTLAVFPDHLHRHAVENALARLRLRAVESPIASAVPQFVARGLTILGLEALVGLSAGAHAGVFAFAEAVHPPLVVMILAAAMVYGVGWRFYEQAFDAAIQGEFDASVVTALLASGAAIAGVPLALVAPTAWLTSAGLVIATTLTAGWFVVRAAQLWRFQFHKPASKKNSDSPAPLQTQLGVLSNGSHH